MAKISMTKRYASIALLFVFGIAFARAGFTMPFQQLRSPALGTDLGDRPFLKRSPLTLATPEDFSKKANPFENVVTMAKAAVANTKAAAASALDMSKYPKLFAAGGLCATITHIVTVPLDVVKTRSQVTPGEFKGLSDGISKIYKAEGFGGIMRGVTPTGLGFLLQGSLKYGFFEFFKDTLGIMTAEEGDAANKKLPIPYVMLAASCAEILGTTALLPFESCRIRMVADPTFAKGMVGTMSKILKTEGLAGLFGGIVPIWCKQVPFTITQFLVYDAVASLAYRQLSLAGVENIGERFGTAITLGSAVIAGSTASIVSQPGDTVLSVMNKASGTSVMQALKQLGPTGLFLGGSTRCVHVTSYIVAQFLIYDSIKRLCGIPVAGADAAKKKAPVSDGAAVKAQLYKAAIAS